jgi:serine/threonine protein kinase/tetratricopeptide (TPR) repeat protein
MAESMAMTADESHDDRTQSFVALTSGTMVSHYKIIEKIGAGGMGEVYLAEDTELDRKVALKFLPSYLCQDEDCRVRFKREARAAAKLNHPNIVTIHEVGEYQGRPFFAMEHVEGQTLKDFSAGKDLTIKQILELGIQISEGLNAAHEKGVIHRDIKPSNILIDSHGRAKIVDFGLASVTGTDKLTKTGSTLGTIGYMSPEQVEGKEIDQRSDLFSMGVVLYEFITKQNPFKRDSEAATLKAVSDDSPEPLARFKRDTPDGLQAIIDKALEKDVKTRYQHADGMLSDLMRVKGSLKSRDSKASFSSVMRRPKRILWAAEILAVTVAVIILLIFKPWNTGNDPPEPERIMLAVLPFENLGDPEDEYFADGMTEELISRLAMIGKIGVIAPTSTRQYKGSGKSVTKIAEELGVHYIVQGTVRWNKIHDTTIVRITPRVISTNDNTLLWSSNFEKPLIRAFTIQADIGTQIAEAFGIALLDHEQTAISNVITTNAEAYQSYLRAKQYYSLGWFDKVSDLHTAERYLLRAVELDSNFAQAYAELGAIALSMRVMAIGDFEEKLSLSKQYIDRASELDSLLPDVQIASGRYYLARLEFDKALGKFERALSLQPNNTQALIAVADINSHYGNWEMAVQGFRKAVELAPTDAQALLRLGHVLGFRRNYPEALLYFDSAISVSPSSRAYGMRGFFTLLKTGNTDSILHYADQADLLGFDWSATTFHRILCDWFDRDFKEALMILDAQKDKLGIDWYYIVKSEAFRLAGEIDLSRLYADSAKEYAKHQLISKPEDNFTLIILGWADAILGKKENAIQAGLKAIQINRSQNAWDVPRIIHLMAVIYCILGEYEKAIDQLEDLLTHPGDESVKTIMRWPQFEPLHDHPRFQALIEKYENKN